MQSSGSRSSIRLVPSPSVVCARACRLLLLFVGAAFFFGCSRSQSASPQTRPPVEFLREWGAPGDGPGPLSFPVSVATDEHGLIYLADAGSRFIHKFDAQGQALSPFTDDRLRRPSGIAVRGGLVYVADYSAGFVFVYAHDGRRLRQVRGGPGRGFHGPIGVTADEEGNLFVLEFDAHRVQRFDARGRFLRAWGQEGSAPGEFRFPVDLAVGPDGDLYVADAHNERIQKFTRDGQFIAAFGLRDGTEGVPRLPAGLAVTADFLLVADSRGGRPEVCSLDSRLLHVEDLSSRLAKETDTPTDVAAGARQ